MFTLFGFIVEYYNLKIMSKIASYYDWNLQFRKKTQLSHISQNETKRIINKEDVNSLGISDKNYKDFMKKWKENNL